MKPTHEDNCEACENSEKLEVSAMSISLMEKQMQEKRTEDVGIYDPILTALWESEMFNNEVVFLAQEENVKFYNNTPPKRRKGPIPQDFDLDIPLPPRPDDQDPLD